MPLWTCAITGGGGDPTSVDLDQVVFDAWMDNLHAYLSWCKTHQEPLWVFGDGSHTCPYDLVTEANHEHDLVAGP